MRRLLPTTILVLGTALAALPAAASDCTAKLRFAAEAGYRFADGKLVFPDGKTEAPGIYGLAGFRSIYGLIGPDDAMQRTIFTDACGAAYQVGYRLEGNTLVMPGGGTHEIRQASAQDAERLLREAYGLVGERDHLDRTKW